MSIKYVYSEVFEFLQLSANVTAQAQLARIRGLILSILKSKFPEAELIVQAGTLNLRIFARES